MQIIANIFSACQVTCFGLSTVLKKEKNIYLLQGLAPVFVVVALVINGGYTAACLAVVTAAANFLALKGEFSKTAFSEMIILMFLIMLITYRQPVDLTSLFAAVEGISVKKYCKTAKCIHLGMSFNCAMYAVTDMYFKLLFSSACDTVFALSSFVSFLRLSKQNKYLALSKI